LPRNPWHNQCPLYSDFLYAPITFELFVFRLSIQIAATEECLGPESSRFREGHTKVTDVEKIYLTGQYKQKYKTISTNYCAPDSARHRLYPLLENRKTRSAYPNVRLKSSHLSHIYVGNGVNEITVKSTVA
jgi:hypothetical protein